MSGPWRAQVEPFIGNENKGSVPEFLNSYPEFAGFNTIARGEIVTLNQTPRKRFHFLVNPSDISTSYRVMGGDMARFADSDFRIGADLSSVGDGFMSVSFNLMLDRTYEVHKGSSDYRGGVLHDVFALERVLGPPDEAYDAIPIGQAGLGTGSRSSVETLSNWDALQQEELARREHLLNGLLVRKPIRVLFGSTDAFSFDGYVDSLSVQYTHFNYRMVPTRGGVTISVSSMGVNANTDSSAPSRSTQSNPSSASPAIPMPRGNEYVAF